MSMNIYIKASRKIAFKKKNGKRGGGIQTVTFNAWQTPTEVTYKIIKTADPKQAYTDWVLEHSRDEEVPVYASDDLFGDCPAVGTKIINEGKEHIQRLQEWVDEVEEQGYTVKFEVI